MKKLNLIELNEVNFEIVKKYVSENPGMFKGFEKLLNLKNIETSSEKIYEQIEPWIQWSSVHTCQTFEQHQVFRLGDIVDFKGEQIFEKIENAGYLVGCMSPMNTENRLNNPAYFVPDPWTNTFSDTSYLSKILHHAIKQAVNDNSQGKVRLSTYISLIWILLTKTQLKNWFTYLNLFKKRKKCWNKALFLDLLLSDVFIYLKERKKESFSCLFLNGFAHIQHHYMLNSKMYAGDLKNKSHYINRYDDPILDAIKLYDKIIYNLLDKFDEKFLFVTALRQVPVDKQTIYYRLKNHEKFLIGLNIKNFEVEPRMTRDFLIKFKNLVDVENAKEILSKLKFKDKLIFGDIEKREKSLFVTLTYSESIDRDDVIELDGYTFNLSEEFVFVANKNGHHDSLGYVYTNLETKILKQGNHVSVIGKEILNFFDA